MGEEMRKIPGIEIKGMSRAELLAYLQQKMREDADKLVRKVLSES